MGKRNMILPETNIPYQKEREEVTPTNKQVPGQVGDNNLLLQSRFTQDNTYFKNSILSSEGNADLKDGDNEHGITESNYSPKEEKNNKYPNISSRVFNRNESNPTFSL